MNIAYFSKTRLPSKAANSVQSMEMCAAFVELSHSVTFFVISESDEENRPDKQVIFAAYDLAPTFDLEFINIPRSRGSRVLYIWSVVWAVFRIRRALKKRSFDLVYSRDVLAALIGASLGTPSVFEAHFPAWFGRLEAVFFRFLLQHKKFKGLVCITDALKSAYLSRYGPRLKGAVVVAPDAARKPREDQSPATLRGSPDALKIGYVGHLYRGKGMEIIAALGEEMSGSEFHVIGGTSHDLNFWKKRAPSNVFFYGFVDRSRIGGYFKAIDVCLLPNQLHVETSGAMQAERVSNIASFTSPLKMFEYMAYAKAIVASDLPVLREILTNTTEAILVPLDDIGAWRAAIEFFSDPDRREKFGQRARNAFLKNYTWQHRAQKILMAIEQS